MDIPYLEWCDYNAFGFPQKAFFMGYEDHPFSFSLPEPSVLFNPTVNMVECSIPGPPNRLLVGISAPDAELEKALWGFLCRMIWDNGMGGRPEAGAVVELTLGDETFKRSAKTGFDYLALEATWQAQAEARSTNEDKVLAVFCTPHSLRTIHQLQRELYDTLNWDEINDATWNLLQKGRLLSQVGVRSRLHPDHPVIRHYRSSTDVPETIEDDWPEDLHVFSPNANDLEVSFVLPGYFDDEDED